MSPLIRRKSSRFSANSDQFTINSNELALSLHVIDPIPLDFINPNPYSSLSPPIRRSSPRNTSNKYKSSNFLDPRPIRPALRPNEGIPSLPSRLVSPGADNRAIVLSGSNGVLGKRKAGASDLSGGKSLRRSKRLNLGEVKVLALTEPVEVRDRCLGSRNVAIRVEDTRTPVRNGSDLGGSGSSVFSERCLRSRKASFVVDGGNEGVEKKNAWGGMASTSEKCLRSRRTGVAVTSGDEGVAKKSSLGESDVKKHRNMRGEVKSSISDVTIGKCLRSGKITTHFVGFENGEKKCALGHSKNYKGVDVKTDMIGLVATSEECSTSREIIVFVGDGRVEIKDQMFGAVVTSETCSGSRDITTLVAVDERAETKLGLIDWPCKDNLGTVVTPLTNDMSSSNVTSKKRLRSGKILTIDHDEIISSLVELTDKGTIRKPMNSRTSASSKKKPEKHKIVATFFGEPVPEVEAQERWSWRYELKDQRRAGQGWILNADEEDEVILNVECHYGQANVDGCIFSIGDCAFIRGDGKKKHIGRILEFFKTTDGENFFRVQWFYKAEDTVMKHMTSFHDKKRLFISTFTNDNPLDCIVSKVNVIEVGRGLGLQSDSIQPSGFYYDMEYCVEYSTFRTLQTDNCVLNRDLSTLNYPDTFCTTSITSSYEYLSGYVPHKAELTLLDLYSGCGGMSTGLCLGAKLSNVNLLTRWAVDYNKVACESFKLNHPETQVRNLAAEDFLELLKEWKKLCKSYAFNDSEGPFQSRPEDTYESNTSTNSPSDVEMSRGEFEVESFVDISYGNVGKSGKCGLKFKVHWKGYDSSEDTWEPIEGLSNCQGHLKDFVRSGSKSKILPMPGEVDVICGGPPCQGISGYNRFRQVEDPLTDERNRQIIIFMDIVKFLKPRYVLMENVADLLRFDKASLGRYALGRLVHMKYQARLGTMAAGCYGVPQFRLRVFLWGALPGEKLPQFPLPTHDVVVRFWPSPEFEQNTVGYDEGQPRELEEALVLRDAISDLPPVTSHEKRQEMTYEMHPETEFQKYIRLTKHEMMGFASQDVAETENSVLSDHRPYTLSEDDYLRVCLIPRRKGANFRDFPGVLVDKENKVFRDPTKEPIMLPSGKPLVPDYVFTFEKGKSKKPFARLWWDETVSTVVTFPSCHNQAALHPEQDRVLTLREYARLQGFPDYYRFSGTVKERYCQVGNAVAVPVAKALGYTLGMAIRKLGGEKPVMILPPKFSTRIPEKSLKF